MRAVEIDQRGKAQLKGRQSALQIDRGESSKIVHPGARDARLNTRNFAQGETIGFKAKRFAPVKSQEPKRSAIIGLQPKSIPLIAGPPTDRKSTTRKPITKAQHIC